MSEANNIISLPSESKIRYNTLYLASKIVCKKDEKILVLFEFYIEPIYTRYPKGIPLFYLKMPRNRRDNYSSGAKSLMAFRVIHSRIVRRERVSSTCADSPTVLRNSSLATSTVGDAYIQTAFSK